MNGVVNNHTDKGAMNGVVDDDIVISGMSGRLPESDNIEEFAKNLFDGVDMVTADDRRWTPGLYGLPERSGKLKELKYFDATFFGVHAKQTNSMDPQLRLLLEATYEAIVDAGFNPAELRGSRTGCYVGVTNSESEEIWKSDLERIDGYAITGCCRAMFPNRISYTFDFKGPSYAINSACSSSLFAFSQAVSAMRAGDCDAAIVAGVNLCLTPDYTLNFHRLGMLAEDGRCAPFDDSSCGYVRSEAAVVVLLQRRVVARRIYATVRCARMNNDGYKEEGITFPDRNMQHQLITETFEEGRLQPEDVMYVEAHGPGTKLGDPQEVNAIADFFCKDRKTPLLLGSVKSNMGHSEAASGLCSIVKMLIAMERGIIPGNLYYKSPNTHIPALIDGRIKVVDRNTPWNGGLVSVQSFGFGGSNAHIVLESNHGLCCPKHHTYSLPRLILASGRTEPAVRALLTHAATHATDAGLHALLDAVHKRNIPGHTHRGYIILGDAPITEIVEMDSNESRPVWFIFSGMGSQSPSVARALMHMPVFAASLQRAAATLMPHGINLLHLLTEAPDSAFDDIINSFVSNASVQVALVDVLYTIGIYPDGMIGHSVGELGCAYADGTLTLEQTVLAAYWRGRSMVDAKLQPGAMAVVDLTWEQCMARCPADIVLACHNSEHNVTVSGPVLSIEKFLSELKTEGVFACRVQTCGLAFHSKYIAAAAPLLQAHLDTLIPNAKPRTARWISTSLATEQWNSKFAKLSGSQYHVNNLLSPVRLAEALPMVPKGALLIEIGPHVQLQAILKRALPLPVVHIGLLWRESRDSAVHLLAALGKIYCAGAQPQLSKLYPSVAWPVVRGTPGLASHVLWDHSTEWNVPNCRPIMHSGANVIEFDLSKLGDAFLAGHEIDGRILFPPIGYITLVWRTVAKFRNKKLEETAIVLHNLQFRRETVVSRDSPVRFLVNILEMTGEFNVCEGGNVIITGKVRLTEDPAAKRSFIYMPPAIEDFELLRLTSDDIYKELRLRGYNYTDAFRGIKSVDDRFTIGKLSWNGHWISFMDTMLQFNIISKDTRELHLPAYIQHVIIDPAAHLVAAGEADEIIVHRCKHTDVIATRGIEIHGVKMNRTLRRSNPQPLPKLEKYVFIPYDSTNIDIKKTSCSKKDALTIAVQLVMENAGTYHLTIVEAALDRPIETLLTPHVLQLFEAEPQVRTESKLIVTSAMSKYDAAVQHLGVKVSVKDINTVPPAFFCHLVLAAHMIAQQRVNELVQLASALADTGMLLLEEPHGVMDGCTAARMIENADLILISRQVADNCDYVLLKRRPELPSVRVVLEIEEDDKFRWIEPLRTALQRAETESLRVYLVSRTASSGVLGLAKCLHKEPGGQAVRVFYLPQTREPFSLTAPTYATQVRNDLAVNILYNGVWGSYRHLLLSDVTGTQIQAEHAYVDTSVCGDLSSLRWFKSPLHYANEQEWPENMELCYVYYTPVNCRDVLLATCKLPSDALSSNLAGQECIPGLEFSGRTSYGNRVMGIVATSGLATTVMADKSFLWQVPETWTLEQAATVPRAYATAYHALMVRGRLKRGEIMLVHAGASALGLAAITIGLYAGCSIFTTVDTPTKRDFLLKRFPTLDNAVIGNSHDMSFVQMVVCQTHGRGVDLVLNSLHGDKVAASVRCLAEGGRFLEFGKLNLPNETASDMAALLKNTTFHCILLDDLFETTKENPDKMAVMRYMAKGIAEGTVKPLPSTIFTENQLEESFRYVASGKSVGKVLICVREEETTANFPKAKLVAAIPRTYFHPQKSYILVGGLGGFGLELGHWLVNRGATRLVFNSRNGVRTGYQAWCIRRWREASVRVVISTADATNPGGARALLREAAELGPVGGVFNLAAVIHNGLLESQTVASFQAVTKPKTDGTKALDMATRELAPELDFFVAFSSIVSGRGSVGTTNYGYANSVMERICEQRRADGLPGIALQWGAIGEVGMVIDIRGTDKTSLDGTLPQRIASCMETLEVLLAQPHPVVASMVLDKKHRIETQQQHDVVHVVANILGIKDPSKISDSLKLLQLGMDSLMAHEIMQIMECTYDLVISIQELRSLTFANLREISLNSRDA